MSTSSIVANVLKVTLLNNNAKVFVLLVSTWIFVTILSSMDINLSQSNSPSSPMYYHTSLKNNPMIKKLQKTSSNKIKIDTRFSEEVDSVNHPEQDSFYDIKNDSEETKYASDNLEEETDKANTNTEYKFETAKKILYFTPHWGMQDWMFGFGNQPFLDHKCPVSNCYITNKRDNISINQFDALLFHVRNMNDGTIHRGIHTLLPNRRKRLPNQRYVMFEMESPQNDGLGSRSKIWEKFNNFFNWTMTFRLDSDFPNPYGWIEPIRRSYIAPPSHKDFPNLTFDIIKAKKEEATLKFIDNLQRETSKKKKLVAWMVSNCETHSQREDYVQELQKHIQVDIIGGCAKLKCKRRDDYEKYGQTLNDIYSCIRDISKEYKFYLSFENSVCNDYVTEKFWNPLSFNSILPVVLGAGNYTSIAPTNSFIDAQKFESPGKLAEYLLYLDGNFEEYSNYFLWKTKFRVKNNNHNLAICKLCEALNDPQTPVKVYSDMKEWWRGGSECKSKGEHPWSPKERPFSFTALLNDAKLAIQDSIKG